MAMAQAETSNSSLIIILMKEKEKELGWIHSIWALLITRLVSLLSVVNRSCWSECSDHWFEGIKFCLKLSDRRSKCINFYRSERPVKIDRFRSPIWTYNFRIKYSMQRATTAEWQSQTNWKSSRTNNWMWQLYQHKRQ